MRAECKHQRVDERPIPRSIGFSHGQACPELAEWDARDTHGRDAHATGRAVPKRYRFVFALSLLLTGTGFGAQPAAPKLLPETAVLDRVDGRLLHVDANEGPQTQNSAFGSPDTWLFELTTDVKTPDYQLPAGTRFVLLPSVTLGRLIADVNDRVAPRTGFRPASPAFAGRTTSIRRTTCR